MSLYSTTTHCCCHFGAAGFGGKRAIAELTAPAPQPMRIPARTRETDFHGFEVMPATIPDRARAACAERVDEEAACS
jgi:hypothetical protein